MAIVYRTAREEVFISFVGYNTCAEGTATIFKTMAAAMEPEVAETQPELSKKGNAITISYVKGTFFCRTYVS